MKYEFKGTLGKWQSTLTEKGKPKVIDAHGFSIATLPFGKEATNDATLIAAAPDLLQACIDALETMNGHYRRGDWGISYYTEKSGALQSAIDKALTTPVKGE